MTSRGASTPCAGSATSCGTRDFSHPAGPGFHRRRRGRRAGRIDRLLPRRPQHVGQRGRQLPHRGGGQDHQRRHHHDDQCHLRPGRGFLRRRPLRRRPSGHRPGPPRGCGVGPELLHHRQRGREPIPRTGGTAAGGDDLRRPATRGDERPADRHLAQCDARAGPPRTGVGWGRPQRRPVGHLVGSAGGPDRAGTPQRADGHRGGPGRDH